MILPYAWARSAVTCSEINCPAAMLLKLFVGLRW
jgi:hypothetical protein